MLFISYIHTDSIVIICESISACRQTWLLNYSGKTNDTFGVIRFCGTYPVTSPLAFFSGANVQVYNVETIINGYGL